MPAFARRRGPARVIGTRRAPKGVMGLHGLRPQICSNRVKPRRGGASTLAFTPACLVSVVVGALALAGCLGHAAPELASIESAEPPVEQAYDPGPSAYESDIGGLSQEDVEEQFQALRPRWLTCILEASGRLSGIGGRATLRMRLDRNGAVRWAYLADSTLGDRDAERCVLDVVKSRKWPRPLSGDGLAESSFDVDPSEPLSAWPKYKTSALERKARAATRECRSGLNGEFRATAYVSPEGDILAAGVAPPDEKGEQASDCIVGALRELRLRNLTVAQRAPVKVSFSLR